MDNLTWTPITVRLSALDFWERNPKRLTKAQAKRLADSTDRLGRAGVLLVGPQDARGRFPLYDGHQRANIWRTLYGADAEVHALQSSRELTEDERLSVSLLTVTAVGSLDFDALAGWDTTVLQDLGLGLDYKHELDDAAANVAAMLEALRAEDGVAARDVEPQLDRAEELQAKWQVQPGDLWALGDNGTLFCGSADRANIVCDLAIYDPPFDWHHTTQETALSWCRWDIAVLLGLHYCMPLAARNDWLHWWVWDAGAARYGGKGYHPTKTCAVVFAFGDKQHFYPEAALEVLDAHGVPHGEYPAQVVRLATGLVSKNYTYEKPRALCDYIVALYSKPGDVVGDPFAGSGGFAVAAISSGRKYRGAEINPSVCAVLLEYYQEATGDTPTRLE